MNKRLTIALVAHDNRKADMVEWAVHNAEFLSHHQLVCTGTTGGLIRSAFDEKGVGAEITYVFGLCVQQGAFGRIRFDFILDCISENALSGGIHGEKRRKCSCRRADSL